MEYSRALGAEFREVQDRTHEGKPARAVIASRTYATNVHELWDTLTNRERIPRWFLPVTGDLRLGGRYQLEGNAGGTITRCDPPDGLDVTWEYAGNVSWVMVRLESRGDETCLTLEHVILKEEAGEEHWRQYGPGATGVGWDLSFFGMGLHIDSGGKSIDREATDAWMASDQGRTFIQACAKDWGTAHIASDEQPDVARTSAARTGAFYTGT